jgi:hypothetical protein
MAPGRPTQAALISIAELQTLVEERRIQMFDRISECDPFQLRDLPRLLKLENLIDRKKAAAGIGRTTEAPTAASGPTTADIDAAVLANAVDR